jgi:hypothetical protein
MKRRRKGRAGRPKAPPKPKIDLGTPELQRKRMLIVGTKPDDPRDMTLSTCPLDALLARCMISEEAHAAGVYFRACRLRALGSPHPKALDLLQVQGAAFTGPTSAAESNWREACELLRRRGAHILSAVESIVIHEQWPWWMSARKGKHPKDRRLFGIGMGELLAWHKTHGQRSGA